MAFVSQRPAEIDKRVQIDQGPELKTADERVAQVYPHVDAARVPIGHERHLVAKNTKRAGATTRIFSDPEAGDASARLVVYPDSAGIRHRHLRISFASILVIA
jgi:hypothetical protein